MEFENDGDLEYLDTWHEDNIICPYCKFEYSDSWEYNTNDCNEQVLECVNCGKEFAMNHEYSVTYTTTKLDKQ